MEEIKEDEKTKNKVEETRGKKETKALKFCK